MGSLSGGERGVEGEVEFASFGAVEEVLSLRVIGGLFEQAGREWGQGTWVVRCWHR